MWKYALDSKKLRLNYNDNWIQYLSEETYMPELWKAIRKLIPNEPNSFQDETINFSQPERDEHFIKIPFTYIFDYDFFSQYDKIDSYTGMIIYEFEKDLVLIVWVK